MPTVQQFSNLVGKTTDEASELVEDDYEIRVVLEDGISESLDLRFNRINGKIDKIVRIV